MPWVSIPGPAVTDAGPPGSELLIWRGKKCWQGKRDEPQSGFDGAAVSTSERGLKLRRVRVAFRVAPATENAPLLWASGQAEHSIPRAPPGPCPLFVSHLRQKTRPCVGRRARRSTPFPGLRRVPVPFRVAPATKNAPLRWAPGQAGNSIPRAPPGPYPVSCRTCDKKRAIAWGSGPGGALESQGSPGSLSRFVSHLRQKTRPCVGRRARRSTRTPGLPRVPVPFRVAPATAHQNSPKSGVLRFV